MVDNSRLQKRSKQKLEPISIAELAGDSTMTGFSDLFKIPTSETHSPAPANRWKRADEIVDGDRLLSSLKAIPCEARGRETSPLVSHGTIEHGSTIEDTTGSETAPAETAPLATVYTHNSINLKVIPHETSGRATSPLVSHGKVKDEVTIDKAIGSETPPIETARPVTTVDAFGNYLVKGASLIETPLVPTNLPNTGRVETGPSVSPLPRKLQIRPAKLVQHGHTYGEQRVYEALWDHGSIVNESLRLITVGFLKMSSIAGLAESNCKTAAAGLIEKLAIERVPDTNLSLGRTYKVYGWKAILKRREALGLTHVIKSRGVVFVDPETGQQLTTAKTMPRRPSEKSGSEQSGPVLGGPASIDQKPRPVSFAAVTDLATRLRNDIDSAFDDSAAGRLWRECQSLVPDCTTDEVIHFVGLKAQRVYRDRKILNPIGLLLMSVPEFFSGTAVHAFRAEKSREERETRKIQEQQQAYWKRVADDPATPSEERELALRFIQPIQVPGAGN